MKRILLSAVAFAALAAPAAAADLATKYPVKAPVVAPVFSWTGFYVGGNVGYGGNSVDQTFSVLDTTPDDDVFRGSFGSSTNITGFFGGLQAGYNYQFSNNVVLGLETDFQWADISGDTSGMYDMGFPFGTLAGTLNTKVEWFGTIRARLGYAFDRFLPYVTGGVAYGQVKTSYSAGHWLGGGLNDYVGGVDVSSSSTNWGWTVGGGFEYAITNNWTIKTEYLYVDLGSNDFYNGSVGLVDNVVASSDTSFHTLKAGVNYKF